MEINDKSLVSLIMPVYNAESSIRKAINSVIEQTYSKWEIIIVDDGSTDGTINIIEEFCDDRIKVLRTPSNTGSAFYPRKMAFENASGEWVVALDSDDYLNPNYIEDLIYMAIKYDLDICMSRMVCLNNNLIVNIIPGDDIEYETIFTGNEAFQYTIPQWRISLNGMLCKKKKWTDAITNYLQKKEYGVHDDEVFGRFILLHCDRVAICKTDYYYSVNEMSVTHIFNPKALQYKESIDDLMSICVQYFGINSSIIQKIKLMDYYAFMEIYGLWRKYRRDGSFVNNKIYNSDLYRWYKRLDICLVLKEARERSRIVAISYFMLGLAFSFRDIKILSVSEIIRKIYEVMRGTICGNKYFAWYIVRRKRESNIRTLLNSKYSDTHEEKGQECVINLFEGDVQAGGLADRLKGIISTYAICVEKGLDYKLRFIHPFPIENFLVPNNYDWRIDREDISYNKEKINIVVLDTTQDSEYQWNKQVEYLRKKIVKNGFQKHIYTNASFAYNLDYSRYFAELFQPSEQLMKSIDKHKMVLGKTYYSISCRFLDLLGDFNETFGYGNNYLSTLEREQLIYKVIKKIETIHFKSPDVKLLINSDSRTFLERIQECEYTYIIPGNITHIDGNNGDSLYKSYEKTFLDFFMIANASNIYLLKTGQMHNSGYPYAASRIYSKPFHLLEF